MEILKNIQLNERFYKDLFTILSKNTIKSEARDNAPFGEGIKEGLNCILDICNKYGFSTTNLENYIGYAEYGNSEDYVGVLGHIDVVPVGNDWDTDPFEPTMKNGKIYARGSLDDKGPLFCALYALKYLKDSNVKLSKKVRIIFGTNEESGTEDIDYYLEREKPPILCFTPDAYFPIVTSEKGILTFEIVQPLNYMNDSYKLEYIKGGKKSNIVPDLCEVKFKFSDKDFLENFQKESLTGSYQIDKVIDENSIILRCHGKSAHASTPSEGENAVCRLMAYLNEVMNCDDHFTKFISEFNKVIGSDYNGDRLGINFQDEESGKLTISLGIIEGNCDEVKMRFNVRYPVTIDYEHILKNIKLALNNTSMEFRMGNHNKPLHFPKDHELIKGLKKAYESTFNDKCRLLASGGGTYAKLMPNTVAFGPLQEGCVDLAHQKNEYIEISQLEKCVEAYARAIYELAK